MTSLPFRDAEEIEHALPETVNHLRAGGLLAYPTETVYGLGCLLREPALDELDVLKGGRVDKPFLLLIADPDHVPDLAWTPPARKLAEAFWPGPLTLALWASPGKFSQRVMSGTGTVAVRVSPHPGLRRLLQQLGEPITSTSANLPGVQPARNALEVGRLLTNAGSARTLILDGGDLTPTLPSTLVDCSVEPPRVVRPGAVSVEELRRVLDDLQA